MSDISRRSFLEAGLAAGAALAVGKITQEGRAEAGENFYQSPEVQFLIQNLAFELDNSTPQCRESQGELPKPVAKIVEEMVALQNAHDSIIARGRIPGPTDHAALWEAGNKLLNRHVAYSEEKFFRLLLQDIPKILAEHGVWVTIGADKATDEHDKVVARIPKFELRRIHKVKNDSLMFNGREYPRQIVMVDQLVINGASVRRGGNIEEAHNARNSIVLDEGLLRAVHDERIQKRPQYLVYFADKDDAFMWNHIAAKSGSEQNKWATIGASQRLMRIFYTQTFSNFNQEANSIAHESGHLLHRQSSSYQADFMPQPGVRSASQEAKLENEQSARAESYGAVGHLLFAKDKVRALMDVVYISDEAHRNNLTDAGHQVAAENLRAAAVEEILAKPEYYGLQFRNDSGISEKNQALFFLPSLALDPPKLEHLARKLYERLEAKQKPGLGVLPEHNVTSSQSATKPGLHRESAPGPCTGGAGEVTIITTAVIAALGLLHRFGRRKQEVEKAEQKRDVHKKRKRKR
ncbi:MAG: hypothetical protein EXS55_00225 [Candidatus Magasanikbacteria bacterium]|nr:hypothetical protein [Candidatus Magasanikbacteria bacterium]